MEMIKFHGFYFLLSLSLFFFLWCTYIHMFLKTNNETLFIYLESFIYSSFLFIYHFHHINRKRSYYLLLFILSFPLNGIRVLVNEKFISVSITVDCCRAGPILLTRSLNAFSCSFFFFFVLFALNSFCRLLYCKQWRGYW